MCPFWVVGANRAYEWLAEIPQQLHHNIKKGPWHYYCGEKSKVRTMNPDFPNVGCFFLTCRQNMPCRFFQWLGREWWDQIFQRRLQEVRKNGWKGKRKEKSSGLAEVDGPLDQKKARVGSSAMSARGKVAGGTREVHDKAAMVGSEEEVEGTQRVAAEVVLAIRRDPAHLTWTVACLF